MEAHDTVAAGGDLGGVLHAGAALRLFDGWLEHKRGLLPLRVSEQTTLLRWAAVAGLGASILYSVLSIFPIIDVPDWRVFTAKVVTVLVATNLLGLGIFMTSRRRARLASEAASSGV